MPSTITIRPATIDDISSIVAVDIAANAAHPVTTIPWSTPEDCISVWKERVQGFVEKRSRYLIYVAVTDVGEVVGQIVGAWPKSFWKEEDKEEWEPQLPEGTNLAFFGYALGRWKEEHTMFMKDDMFELESLSISPDYQRKNIGNMLIERWFKDANIYASGKDAYVLSSAKGKGLYERFGWKVVHERVVTLDEFVGKKMEYTNWSMLREAEKSEQI